MVNLPDPACGLSVLHSGACSGFQGDLVESLQFSWVYSKREGEELAQLDTPVNPQARIPPSGLHQGNFTKQGAGRKMQGCLPFSKTLHDWKYVIDGLISCPRRRALARCSGLSRPS